MKHKTPKPRNQFVKQLIRRAGAGSGAHTKSAKAQRSRTKSKLKRGCYE